jgi:hypothetical protein
MENHLHTVILKGRLSRTFTKYWTTKLVRHKDDNSEGYAIVVYNFEDTFIVLVSFPDEMDFIDIRNLERVD